MTERPSTDDVDPQPPAAAPAPPPVHLLALPAVTCHRSRLRLPTAKVQTLRFAEAKPAPPPKKADPEAPPRHRPAAPPPNGPRNRPPSSIPIRDRLLALLQPPLSTILGDNEIWLPFEPFPYQYQGINFLFERWSAMLGDEMGLGKTMQTILAMRLLLRARMVQSVLLICPKPLMTNWLREFSVWAEEIPVSVLKGDTWSRRTLWLHDRSPVKLANYESLTRDEDLLRDSGVSFDLVVLDEAQRIKNRNARTADTVHSLRRKRSWALTGTPVENRASDLVSLLEFVGNDRMTTLD
ncbi:MAG: SNF2-related protein, partial [Planctomycetia bacterium]